MHRGPELTHGKAANVQIEIPSCPGVYEWAAQIAEPKKSSSARDPPPHLFAFYLGKAGGRDGLRGRFKQCGPWHNGRSSLLSSVARLRRHVQHLCVCRYVGHSDSDMVMPCGDARNEFAKKKLFEAFQQARNGSWRFRIFYRCCGCSGRGDPDVLERYYLRNMDYAANHMDNGGARPAERLRMGAVCSSRFLSDMV